MCLTDVGECARGEGGTGTKAEVAEDGTTFVEETNKTTPSMETGEVWGWERCGGGRGVREEEVGEEEV